MWRQEQIYGYWDIDVKKAGHYDLNVHFFDPVGQPGELLVRVGPVQRTITNTDPDVRTLELKKVPLRKGQYMLESWYVGEDWRSWGGAAFTQFPFFIEVWDENEQ